jgi:uncharacterized YigZ family protein
MPEREKMAKGYPIPAREARAEIVVVNSRFIATAAPAFTVEDAKAFIQRIKREFADASHHVPAYLVGYGSTVIAHCTDADEPSGTAGRPALAVLRGSGLGDIVVVITRYFGGTKLGTGGLVRAYTEATQAVLAALPRAKKIPTHTVMFSLPYAYFEQARLLVVGSRGHILDEEFSTDVTITARFLVERFPQFQQELIELTRGVVKALIIETNPDTIVPMGSNEGLG